MFNLIQGDLLRKVITLEGQEVIIWEYFPLSDNKDGEFH